MEIEFVAMFSKLKMDSTRYLLVQGAEEFCVETNEEYVEFKNKQSNFNLCSDQIFTCVASNLSL